MKLKFHTPLKTGSELVTFIRGALKKSNLPAEVSAGLVSDHKVRVTISKFGTSTLTFDLNKSDDGLTCSLASQEISMFHRSYMDDVKSWIVNNVVKASGGSIVA